LGILQDVPLPEPYRKPTKISQLTAEVAAIRSGVGYQNLATDL
jgi:hypothetical protein